MSFIALIVALILTMVLLGQVNSITNKQIAFNFTDIRFLRFIMLLTLATGIISGLLPGLKFASAKIGIVPGSKNSSKSSIGTFRAIDNHQ